MQTLEEEIKLPPWGQEVRQLTQEGVRQENTEWGKAGAKRGALSTAEEQVWVGAGGAGLENKAPFRRSVSPAGHQYNIRGNIPVCGGKCFGEKC